MPNMPTPIVEPGTDYWTLFTALSNDLSELHVDWDQYRKLFGTNTRRVELLNKPAPGFFSRAQWMMLSHTAIVISRLLDPVSMGGKPNLVLTSVIDALDDPSQRTLQVELQSKLDDLKMLSAPVVALRHKRLAHRDKPVALGDTALDGISRELIENILEGIRDLMNHAQLTLKGSTTAWGYTSLPADGDALITALRRSAAFDELMASGKIDRAEITRLPYGDV